MTESRGSPTGGSRKALFERSGNTVDALDSSNEMLLFLVSKGTGISPYWHEFVMGGLDAQLLGAFISAMSTFMGEMTGATESSWTTTYGRDSTLIVEAGKWIVGVIVVSRETGEIRSKLHRVVVEFESSFALLRDADGFTGSIMRDLDDIVRTIFMADRLSDRTVVTRRDDWSSRARGFELPSVAFRITKMLQNMTDGQRLGEVANNQGMSSGDARELMSKAYWSNLVSLRIIPHETDILSLPARASSVILDPENRLGLSVTARLVLAEFDGRTALGKLLGSVNPDERAGVLDELGGLINMGYIQKLPAEQKLVLVSQCCLSRFYRMCIKRMGFRKIKKSFDRARRQGLAENPWTGRVKAKGRLDIECMLEESMTPSDLYRVNSAIQDIIGVMVKSLSSESQLADAQQLLEQAREECAQSFYGVKKPD